MTFTLWTTKRQMKSYPEIMRLRTAVQNRPEYSTFIAVDALNQHNTDLLACLWNDLYTVISLQKEKGPRAPSLTSRVL